MSKSDTREIVKSLVEAVMKEGSYEVGDEVKIHQPSSPYHGKIGTVSKIDDDDTHHIDLGSSNPGDKSDIAQVHSRYLNHSQYSKKWNK
jgi:hypothetical protein